MMIDDELAEERFYIREGSSERGPLAAAYAYELSGSLLAPTCLHILWNTLQETAHTARFL